MEEKVEIKEEIKRESNMDLLRIIGMLMVIITHCIIYLNLSDNPSLSPINSLLIRFLDSFVLPANAIFFLLSGYFSINKKFKLKRILCLWGRTVFYSVLFLIIALLLNKKTDVYTSIFPVLTGQYWFISAYIALAFLAPILNIMINKLNKKQNTYLLIVLIILLGIIRTVFNPSSIFSGNMFAAIFVYMVGAYLKKYVTVKQKQYYFTKFILIAVILSLVYIILTILMNYCIENIILVQRLMTIRIGIRDFCSIFILPMAVLLWMKFKTVTIKSNKISKFLTLISPSIFSVYLIHENINVNRNLWNNTDILNYADSWLFIPYILLIAVLVFAVCICIDLARKKIYLLLKKIPLFNKFVAKLNKKIDRTTEKINNYITE